jgi:hypothetical protein
MWAADLPCNAEAVSGSVLNSFSSLLLQNAAQRGRLYAGTFKALNLGVVLATSTTLAVVGWWFSLGVVDLTGVGVPTLITVLKSTKLWVWALVGGVALWRFFTAKKQ